MKESKINLTTRLRTEGRWTTASIFKDEMIKKLRSEGATRAAAASEAWERMAAQYPPLAITSEVPASTIGDPTSTQQPGSTEPDVDVDALLERIGDSRPSDLIRDTLWTYENLANQRIKASDAPSCGAWALLEWARQYRNRFFEMVLPKAMSNQSPKDEDDDGALYLSLGLTPATLAQGRRSGELRFTRKGKRLFYLGQWILDWIKADTQRNSKEVDHAK